MYVAEKGPLPTEMIVKAYQRFSLKICQLQKVNEIVNGTLYYGYVVKSSRAAEPSITKVMSKDFLYLMEGNEARRNPGNQAMAVNANGKWYWREGTRLRPITEKLHYVPTKLYPLNVHETRHGLF